jgi:hypothetical protein
MGTNMAYKNVEDQRAYAKKHYQENKKLYKDRAKTHSDKQRIAITVFLTEAKSAPCTDCGVSYPPYVMDFDHLSDKKGNVSEFRGLGWSLKRVKQEVAKCELVCSNCHRERTHQRRAAVGSNPTFSTQAPPVSVPYAP